jgi:hypothetical protein
MAVRLDWCGCLANASGEVLVLSKAAFQRLPAADTTWFSEKSVSRVCTQLP